MGDAAQRVVWMPAGAPTTPEDAPLREVLSVLSVGTDKTSSECANLMAVWYPNENKRLDAHHDPARNQAAEVLSVLSVLSVGAHPEVRAVPRGRKTTCGREENNCHNKIFF